MFEDVGIGMIPQPSPPSVCAELPASSSSPPTLLYDKGGGEAGRPAPAEFQLWMIYNIHGAGEGGEQTVHLYSVDDIPGAG